MRVVGLFLLLIFAMASTAQESGLEQLRRNQALSDSLHITDYQYSIDYEGSGWIDPPVMLVVVRNGKVHSVSQNTPPLRLLECVFPVPNPGPCNPHQDREGLKRTAQTIPQLFDSLTPFVLAAQTDPKARVVLDF